MSQPVPDLHPAENRALRELYASLRRVVDHWPSLAERLTADPAASALRSGADAAHELLRELAIKTPEYDLYGREAAQGVGARSAQLRGALGDRFLERNQAVRFAVAELQHAVTLLGYLGALAEYRGDPDLREMHGRWERKLKRLEGVARKAAIAMGEQPDSAIAPLDSSTVGRAAHGVAHAVGSLGEWFDRRSGRAAGS